VFQIGIENRPFGTFAAVAVSIGCSNEAVVGSKGAECEDLRRGAATSVRRRNGYDSWPAAVRPLRSRGTSQPTATRRAQGPEVGGTSREPRPVTRPLCVPMIYNSGEQRRGLLLDNGGSKVPRLTHGFLCACGYKVRCGVSRYGDQLGGLVFFDNEKTSRTRGEEVRQCPGCNSRLGLLGLLP
jgi:hypothetical protein